MALYDRIGTHYDYSRRADPYIAQRLYHIVRNGFDGKYLDIACGSGNYTVALMEAGLDMYGVDLSEVMNAAARQKTDKVNWTVTDAERSLFGDGFFSGAICTRCLPRFIECWGREGS